MRAARRIPRKHARRLLPGITTDGVEAVRRKGLASKRFSSLSYLDLCTNSTRNAAPTPVGFRKDLSAVAKATRAGVSIRRKSSAAQAQTDKNSNLMNYEAAKEMTKVMDEPAFHKLGSFSEETWRKTTFLARSWTQFETQEGINASFSLVERLVMEQEILLQNRASIQNESGNNSVVMQFMSEEDQRHMQSLSRELLNTELLNEVIKTWRNCWKTNQTKISPMMIVTQLEGYMDRSPSFHPDCKTYNMIMNAVTSRYGHKKAEELAEDIFQRMVNNSNSTAPSPKYTTVTPRVNGKRLRCINDISPDIYTYTTLINIYSNSGNAKAAEEILNRMEQEYMQGISNVSPNVRTFTACIAAWARSTAPDAPERAEDLLERMHQLDQDGILKNVKPNRVTYNCLLDCWAKSGRKNAGNCVNELLSTMKDLRLGLDNTSYSTAIKAWITASNDIREAEALLKRMYGFYKFYETPSCKPTLETYHFILEGLSRRAEQDNDAPHRAEKYLKGMVEIGIKPTVLTYNLVLNCWANCQLPTAGGHAENMLRQMKAPTPDMLGRVLRPVSPNTTSYNCVIDAYAKSGKADRAEILFKAMYGEYRRGNKQVKPKLRTFNYVLTAWSNCGNVSDAERVKTIVRLMQELPKSGVLGITPDIVSYNILLHCLSKLNTEESRKQADTVLSEIEREWEITKNESLRPNRITYSSVMQAHANVGDLFKAKELFKRMFDLYMGGDDSVKPDTFVFNFMLQAISRGARGRNEDAGKLAEDLFKQMLSYNDAGVLDCSPNTETYNVRISCWANSGNAKAGEKADEILQEMEELRRRGYHHLKPDAISYTAVINAHAKSGNHKRAEELLTKMLQEYSQGNSRMKPSLQTINSVLASLARSNDSEAPEKAESYLREMMTFHDSSFMDLKPDAVTFSTVISAWVKSGDKRAAERAKILFREAEANHIELDAGFYRSLLRACSMSGDVKTAERLVEEIANGNKFENMAPDRYMCHSLLVAYAKSNDDDAAEKAETLLKRMNSIAASTGNKMVLPDANCYRIVLDCWGKSKHLELAVDRSEALLLEMEQKAKEGEDGLKPSPATYVRVINTMARAGEKERIKETLKRMYRGGNGNVEAVVAT